MATPLDAAAPHFRLRSTHPVLRALTVIVVCAAVIAGFILQVQKGPAPKDLRTAAEPAALRLRA